MARRGRVRGVDDLSAAEIVTLAKSSIGLVRSFEQEVRLMNRYSGEVLAPETYLSCNFVVPREMDSRKKRHLFCLLLACLSARP